LPLAIETASTQVNNKTLSEAIMKQAVPAICLLLLLIVLAPACGGGGGGSSGGVIDPPDPLLADFSPANSNPGPNTVSMSRRSATGNPVTINVNVTDTDNIFGASFDVVYPDSLAEYTGYAAGDLLEEGGHSPFYNVTETSPGRIVVVASRTGSVPAVDVTGTRVLIRLAFRLTREGSGLVVFENANLSDDQLPPQNLTGIDWDGGTLLGT
jgi:hypothetical protein